MSLKWWRFNNSRVHAQSQGALEWEHPCRRRRKRECNYEWDTWANLFGKIAKKSRAPIFAKLPTTRSRKKGHIQLSPQQAWHHEIQLQKKNDLKFCPPTNRGEFGALSRFPNRSVRTIITNLAHVHPIFLVDNAWKMAILILESGAGRKTTQIHLSFNCSNQKCCWPGRMQQKVHSIAVNVTPCKEWMHESSLPHNFTSE